MYERKILLNLAEQNNIAADEIIRVASLNVLNKETRLEERTDLLVEELVKVNPDVLCLQEILEHKQEFYVERLNEAGYRLVGFGETKENLTGTLKNGNAVFSRHEPDEKFEFKTLESSIATVGGVFQFNGNKFHIMSAHFSWGSKGTPSRNLEAVDVNQYALNARQSDSDAVVMLLGDLNCTPDSDTLRYLTGKHVIGGESTIWVDAYDYAGNQDEWFTLDNGSYWAVETSAFHNRYRPAMGIKRRIDYILSYEWVYGKPGCPLSYNLWGELSHEEGFPTSDHYGVWAEIYAPHYVEPTSLNKTFVSNASGRSGSKR